MGQEQFQVNRWKELPLAQVPHGAHISPDLFRKYMPPTFYPTYTMDFGGGAGDINDRLPFGYEAIILDVNGASVHEARKKGNPAWVSDVRRMGFDINADVWMRVYLEAMPVITAEALLCNQIGHDLQDVLITADLYLAPGGLFIGADLLRMDQPNLIHELGLDSLLGADIGPWRVRYESNRLTGLDKGTFVVMPKPLEDKDLLKRNEELEWGGPDVLRKIIQQEQHERFARHFHRFELPFAFANQGFELLEWRYRVFYSRTGKPLFGCEFVCRKPDIHKYDPWKKGLTRQEGIDFRFTDSQKEAIRLWPEILDIGEQRRLKNNIPESHRAVFGI